MVDIHCHILPGLDDGPDSLAESLQMAEMAIADGITHVIATPHASEMYAFDPQRNRHLQKELQEKLGNRLTLGTGCDFHLSYENLQALRSMPSRFTLNQKQYLLVEFADFAIPPTLDQTLHELILAGLRPIITHPERNALLRAQPQRLAEWIRMGCAVQLTALSLLGRFGEAAKSASDALLEKDAVHFVASDAHSVKGRPLRLREAFELVSQVRGHRVARALFHDNPLAVFQGLPLPYVPEPPEFSAGPLARKKKRFWFF